MLQKTTQVRCPNCGTEFTPGSDRPGLGKPEEAPGPINNSLALRPKLVQAPLTSWMKHDYRVKL